MKSFLHLSWAVFFSSSAECFFGIGKGILFRSNTQVTFRTKSAVWNKLYLHKDREGASAENDEKQTPVSQKIVAIETTLRDRAINKGKNTNSYVDDENLMFYQSFTSRQLKNLHFLLLEKPTASSTSLGDYEVTVADFKDPVSIANYLRKKSLLPHVIPEASQVKNSNFIKSYV